ncbi:hypothetical protein AB7714_29960 [Tardiphaga sp. 1201_B9_N1_1]|uniref:hypothetical protein n=1 Tax=unclassified Tardiphaga TaxID=2631404 RepID=UPI003F23F792
MKDADKLAKAVLDIELLIADYLSAGGGDADRTITEIIELLDRDNVVVAAERVQQGWGERAGGSTKRGAKSHVAWTPQEDARLLEELKTERPFGIVARAHKRTASAIKGRVARLRRLLKQEGAPRRDGPVDATDDNSSSPQS